MDFLVGVGLCQGCALSPIQFMIEIKEWDRGYKRGFLRRVAGVSLRDKVRSSVVREEHETELLLFGIERSQLRWFGHLVRMPPGHLLREMFQICPAGRRPQGTRPRPMWRHYISALSWGTPRDPSVRAGWCGQGKGSLGPPAETAASLTQPWISRWPWVDDGRIDRWIYFESFLLLLFFPKNIQQAKSNLIERGTQWPVGPA